MRKYLFAAIAIALSLTQLATARAGAISELVIGPVNMLEDDNFERFFKGPGNIAANTIEVGDRFLGTIRIQGIEGPPETFGYVPGGNDVTFTGVFAVEAAAIEHVNISGGLDPDRTNVYFKPLGTTDWDTAFGLTGINPDNPNTILQFWDDLTIAQAQATGSLQDAVSNFMGSNKVYEFGFEGAAADFNGGLTDAGEFFIATGDFGSQVIGVDLAGLRNIINMNVIEMYNDAVELRPHTYLAGDGVSQPRALEAGASFANAADFQAMGNIASTNASGPFPIRTDTDLYIQPVPEPSSLAIFAIGTMGGAFVIRNRRRKAAAQA